MSNLGLRENRYKIVSDTRLPENEKSQEPKMGLRKVPLIEDD
jgi:hypothetical protein